MRQDTLKIVLFVLLLTTALTVLGQESTPAVVPEPLAVHSAGLLDADGTALYSVLIASGEETLSDLTITASVPEGASFVEAFWTPEAATFDGEQEGVVTWMLPEPPAETVIGPFTFRVTFEDDDTPKPLNVAAMVTAGDLSADAPLVDHLPFPYTTELRAHADSASIVIPPEGTEVAVPVGETGAWLHVPEDAVSQSTTHWWRWAAASSVQMAATWLSAMPHCCKDWQTANSCWRRGWMQ